MTETREIKVKLGEDVWITIVDSEGLYTTIMNLDM
jgi:hypothetical protein